MIKGVLLRQAGKVAMIAFTIALGASLATAMLNVMLDVGDKVNQELKTYGANITVVPKDSSVIDNLYEVEGGSKVKSTYLKEDELGNIKTIFWAFNIVDFTPMLQAAVTAGGEDATVTGAWFNHHLDLPTGETLDTGIVSLRSWWTIDDGAWIDEQAKGGETQLMVGTLLASQMDVKVGDKVKLKGSKASKTGTVVGIFTSGDDADRQIYAPMDFVQELSGLDGKLSSIEVSALTTPDNELSRKAAIDPSSLTVDQYETWYCTAYVSSICYQIQEVITGSVASPVRQVAESEGAILEKTQLLMILITILALAGSALGISNLVTASVMERSQEIGLYKALGASNRAISALVIAEVVVMAILGGLVGYFVGFGFAQIIGQTVFNSAIEMKSMVIPIVAVLVLLITLAGSIPGIRTATHLDPVEVLHGH